NDVEPVEVDRLLIAVSETYDIVVQIPTENISFEFIATSEDRINNSSIFLGNGVRQLALPLPKLKYFEGMKMMNDMMNTNGTLNDMGMKMSLNKMDMNMVMYPEITGNTIQPKRMNMQGMQLEESYNANALSNIVTLNYSMLQAPHNTSLPNATTKILQFELTGNMNRYVWSLNNKVVSEADKILIKKGENVKIILYNGSMMRHPMHLHGHDFRLLNGKGIYAPLKNVVDIMPMETDTLEFNANAEGDWFFHCHILYHMMSGMGRIFSYTNQLPNPYIPNPNYAKRKLFSDDRRFHFMVENDFATNGNDGNLMVQNTRWSLNSEWRLGYSDVHGYETEIHVGKYFDRMQWFMPFIGFDWRYRLEGHSHNSSEEENIFGVKNTKNNRAKFTAGINYTLPMLVIFQTEIFEDGYFRIQLERHDIPISKKIRMGFNINSDKEYMLGYKYILNRNIGLTAHYDSDMGFGIGFSALY
ncbi:MAG: multicopper oxidase domain-containing protein, partial [Sediminibacterium sp.]|nr:multicopper oxidase domain-containing protein [Sediminibacterium sp.]